MFSKSFVLLGEVFFLGGVFGGGVFGFFVGVVFVLGGVDPLLFWGGGGCLRCFFFLGGALFFFFFWWILASFLARIKAPLAS